jgi:transcriptional repressor NF-X1
MARCWCGKEEKEIGCGEGEEQQCFVEGQPPWMGRFSCDNLCEGCAHIFSL